MIFDINGNRIVPGSTIQLVDNEEYRDWNCPEKFLNNNIYTVAQRGFDDCAKSIHLEECGSWWFPTKSVVVAGYEDIGDVYVELLI